MIRKLACLLVIGMLLPGIEAGAWGQDVEESEEGVPKEDISYDTVRMTWRATSDEIKCFTVAGTSGFMVVYWGDGDSLVWHSSSTSDVQVAHAYAEAGVYDVMLCGTTQLILLSDSVYVERIAGIEIPMVYVQGGTFFMGGTAEQGSYAENNEKPVHVVMLDGFYIGKFEVTQAQWEAVMGTTVSQQRDKAGGDLRGVGDAYPMYYVSWNEAVEFCEKLSEMTGKPYRLPTEAEWEYAARGGQQADGTVYAGSNTIGDVAWYGKNSGNKTHPVGAKQPNALGLYDMSGNVAEWCSDWYGSSYYSNSPSVNPQGPSSGSNRVYRGGNWYTGAGSSINLVYLRVSYRGGNSPDHRSGSLGFRVVCER